MQPSFFLEHLVGVPAVFQLDLGGDQEAGVDLAVLDLAHQGLEIALHMGLAGLEGQALADEGAPHGRDAAFSFLLLLGEGLPPE
jgi:hypothetical protein